MVESAIKFNANQRRNIKRERKQVLSWIYYKKWNVLVDDFYYFIADKMNYETEDSDDESE